MNITWRKTGSRTSPEHSRRNQEHLENAAKHSRISTRTAWTTNEPYKLNRLSTLLRDWSNSPASAAWVLIM